MECKSNKRIDALPSLQFQEASQNSCMAHAESSPAESSPASSAIGRCVEHTEGIDSCANNIGAVVSESLLCQSITRLIAPDLISTSKDGIPSAKLFKLAIEENIQSGDILASHRTDPVKFHWFTTRQTPTMCAACRGSATAGIKTISLPQGLYFRSYKPARIGLVVLVR